LWVLERQLSAFHACDDLFELGQRAFEVGLAELA